MHVLVGLAFAARTTKLKTTNFVSLCLGREGKEEGSCCPGIKTRTTFTRIVKNYVWKVIPLGFLPKRTQHASGCLLLFRRFQ